MSAQLDKTKEQEDRKKEDEDFSDEDHRSAKKSDKDFKSADQDDFEEDDGTFTERDEERSRGEAEPRREPLRHDTEEEEGDMTPTIRNDEDQGLMQNNTGEGDKYVSYQFPPISSEINTKEFDEKTKYRFSMGARIFKSCC